MLDHATGPDLPQALRHEGALRRLAAALLRDPTDVDDAVQHALAQEGLGRRRPGTPLLPFLRATVRRWASNLRTLARRRQRREAAAARPEALPSAMEIAAREQLRRRVADAVQALDEPYRSTVWLRWFEGLAAHEVAARMAVPVATVRTRLQRAHARLRQRLDRDYGDRRAWAAAALPFAELAPVAAALAFGVALPKVLASAAAVFVLLLGYALWPLSSTTPVAPRRAGPAATVALAVAGQVPQRDDTELRERISTAAAAPVAVSRTVRIVYADGTPARDLQAWLWHAQDRPRWATRAGDGPGTLARGVANAYDELEPPPAAGTTGDGAVAVPADATALSVCFAERQWVSVDLTPALAVVELPAVQPIELHLRGGTADREWEATLQPTCIDRDDEVLVSDALRVDLSTRSGAATVLLRTLTLHGRADQVLRALVLTDRLWHVDGDGHGMAVRVPGEREVNQVDVMAPRSVEFLLGGVLPRVRVRVVEATGLPTELPGHVGVFYLELQHSLIEQDRELVHGEAVVDEVELPRDRVIPVDVLMADGEWLHRELPAIGERLQHEVGFVRGSGQAGRRLPAALALREIQNVYLEDAAGQWSGVQLGARFSFLGPNGRPEARLQDGAGSLLLSCVPQDAVRAIVVAHDGRVADFALESDGRVAGGLLPSEALAPIDTAAIYREHGAQRDGQVMLQVRIATRTGGQEWVVIRHHEMWFEGALPPTVWEGIWVPKDLPSRLVLHRHVDGRIEPGEELPLPRLGTAR